MLILILDELNVRVTYFNQVQIKLHLFLKQNLLMRQELIAAAVQKLLSTQNVATNISTSIIQ